LISSDTEIKEVSQKIEQPLVEAGGVINPDGSKIAMQTWSKKGEIKHGKFLLVDSHPIQS